MSFYATCPYCKVPAFMEDNDLERTRACASCGKLFRPHEDTGIQASGPLIPPSSETGIRDEGAVRRPWDEEDDYFDERRLRNVPRFRGQSAGNVAAVLLLLLIASEAVTLALELLQYAALVRWEEAGRLPGDMPGQGQGTLEFVVMGWSCMSGVLQLILIVYYLMWVYQSYDNLVAMSVRGLTSSPVLAVVWYFIPFANWIFPFLVMAEVWKASAPDKGDEDWKLQSWPLSIVGWWISRVLSEVLAGISIFVALGASLDNAFNPQVLPDARLIKASHLLNMGAAILSMIAAACAVLIIRSIMARQKEKYERCFGQDVRPY